MINYYQNYFSDKKYFKVVLIGIIFYDGRNVKYILKFIWAYDLLITVAFSITVPGFRGICVHCSAANKHRF